MDRPRTPVLLLTTVVLACTTSGRFEGEMREPKAAMPAPAAHEDVQFSWTSNDGGISGDMKVRLASGETFVGTFHQITRTTTATRIDGFYGSWYGGPWVYRGWGWGGAWPYYDDPRAFVVFYTGKVLALLRSSRDNEMRCRFDMLDSEAGMEQGGVGECQIEDGRRVTAWFGPTDDDEPGAPISRR